MNQRLLVDIVAEMRSLEPFPSVAAGVLEVAAQPNVVPGDLVELVQTDPGLTAKVLKLCNSAFYGFQREIASLPEAGNRLGVDVLVNLVMTSCANRYFRDFGSGDPERQESLWQRSICTALSSKLLADVHGGTNSEQAYTAGLLQNIGNLVVERFLTPVQDDVIELAREGTPLIEAERRILGMTHAEIGARLAARWGLPEILVDTIRHHHAPSRATVDPVLAGTVHLAETLSWALGLGEGVGDVPYDVSPAALDLTGLDKDHFGGVEPHLREAMARASSLMEA